MGASLCARRARDPRRATSEGDPIRQFSVGHTMSLRNNALSGIALGGWLRVLWTWRRAIEFRTYAVRVLFLTAMACLNSLFGLIDTLFFGVAIARAVINPRPVFVLGHPRTGTTLLHTLLAKDRSSFIFCSTFQAGFPSGFACLDKLSWLFAGVVDKTRPMDNMALSLDLPQEEELATNVLSGGRSQYMSIFLMRQERYFRKYVSFEGASEGDLSAWTRAFNYMLRKLSYVNDGGSGRRRLLLKSPVHTGRVRLLLKLFPDAQFIYLHRDPYRVFQSACNMADKAYPFMYLNTPDNAEIQEFVLSQFEQLHDLYVRDRGLIKKGNLLEMSFDQLTEDPIRAVEAIYKHFKWPGFDKLRPELEGFQKRNKGYKKNAFSGLSAAERKMVARRWKKSFDEFQYKV